MTALDITHYLLRRDLEDGFISVKTLCKDTGVSFAEHVDIRSHFIPIKRTHIQKHKNSGEAIDYHNHLTELFDKQIATQDKDVKPKFETHESGFLSIRFVDKNPVVLQIYNCKVVVLRNEDGSCKFIFDVEIPEEARKHIGDKAITRIDVWFGNDPTYCYAGGVSSLGCWLLGFEAKECKVESFSPFIISGDREQMTVRLNRPARMVL